MIFVTFYANLLISGKAFKRKHEQEMVGNVLIQGNVAVFALAGILVFFGLPPVKNVVSWGWVGVKVVMQLCVILSQGLTSREDIKVHVFYFTS